jgi:tripartite-type tricarboxylate transporter receptor subunit TctC
VLVAPVGTPAPIIAKVSADLKKVVTDADFGTKLAGFGNYPRAMTPEEILVFVDKEQQAWAPIVQKISAQ